MRYLILSDLHANWEALEAVTRETAGHYDKAICCGDLVGYAADPNRVVEWVRANCAVVVRGNHDRACTGLDDLEWFNPVARQAALWTQEHLTRENVDYTATLSKGPVLLDDFEVVHGSPYDEDEYVLAAGEAGQAFTYLESRLAFFGHTHVQGGFIWNHSRVETIGRVAGAQRQREPGYRPRLRLSDQSRLGGPAARRRPARRLCDVRFQRARGDLSPRALRRGDRAEEDPRRRLAAYSGGPFDGGR